MRGLKENRRLVVAAVEDTLGQNLNSTAACGISPPASPVPVALLAGKGAVAGMASWCCWLGRQDLAACEISMCLARWFGRYLLDGEIA